LQDEKYIERDGVRGVNLVAIDSGANMNFDRLHHVAERSNWASATKRSSPSPSRKARQLPQVLPHHRQAQRHEFNYRYADNREAMSM